MPELVETLFGGDAFYLAVLGVVLAAVGCLVLGVRYLVTARTDAVRERLRRSVTVSSTGVPGSVGTSRDDRPAWQSALEPIASVARPGDEEELGRLKGRLSHAGYRNERAMVVYLAAKVLLGLVLAGAFLVYNSLRPQELTHAAFFTILAMAVGFYAPTLWVNGRIKERQREINHALPNALDLLVTCVEAGLGLDAALGRVAEELALSAPLLSQELRQASMEMRAGVSRGDAFRRLADRTGVEELRSLSAIIIQTQTFGTSVAKSLRVQSEAMRTRRTFLAEERAAAAAVKMSVPLVLCITPALFAILMGPAAVQIIRVLLPTLGGGN